MKSKAVFFAVVICLSYANTVAQSISKEFDKLVFLYIDGKYVKCANLGLKYTEDDKLRRDPIPYLYVSMSMFEISRIEALSEKHPNAFKNSLKYAYKYRKKDKNGILNPGKIF